jgi:hypothetical protein
MIASRARMDVVDRPNRVCYHERPFNPAAICGAAVRVIENINSNDVQILTLADRHL